LGGEVFLDCSNLTSVTIGKGLGSIPDNEFFGCTSLSYITIPATVTNLGYYAFGESSLLGVFFLGNSPSVNPPSQGINYVGSAYYFPGTSGWTTNLGSQPTVLWNPLIQKSSSSFGVKTNHFGFTVTGNTNIPILIQASTTLTQPVWTTLQSSSLTNGSFSFSDPGLANKSADFYRVFYP
jgi:hypothetical protein